MFPPHLMQSRGYGSSVLNPNKTWESTYFPDLVKRLKLGSDRETEIQKEAFAPALRAAMGLGRIGLKGLKYGAQGYRKAFPHVPTAGGARALKWTPSPASAAGPSWWKRFLRLNKPDTRYLTSPGTQPLIIRKPTSTQLGFSKGAADEGSSGFLATLLRNLRDASLVGAGGVSAGTAGDFLRKQLKHIKQYNPTIVSASPDRSHTKSVLRRILPMLREGDVLVHGDMPIDVKDVARQKELQKQLKSLNSQIRAAGGEVPKRAPGAAIKRTAERIARYVTDLGSGGMGGFDEHAKIFTRPKTRGIKSYGPLISVTPTHVPDNPRGRRTPWVPAAEKARKNLMSGRRTRRHLVGDPIKRYRLAQAAARKPISQNKLNALLKDTATASDELLDFASKKEPIPFSIMRPKEYSQRQAHQYLRQVANTTFDTADTWQAALQRRLMPRWASDLIEKVRTKIRPGASQQGTNCAGGVCKAILGKGAYNLPSDLRHMKEFDTVVDVMPENVLKRMGGTAKNLDPVRKIMRRGAFRGSLPGVLGGLGLMGLGAYGAMKRASDRYGSLDDGRRGQHDYLDWLSGKSEKTLRDRFGAPNQQSLINKIVRSKGGHGLSSQVPPASQKKAPRPSQALHLKPTDPIPMHPGIADFYKNTWHGPGQYNHPLFNKDGSDRYGSLDDGTPLEFPQIPVHKSWWPTIQAKYGPPEQQPLISKMVRAKMGRRALPVTYQRSQHKKWRPGPATGHRDKVDPYKIGGRLGVPKDLPPISSHISSEPPQLGHLFKKDGTPIDAWSAQRKMIN